MAGTGLTAVLTLGPIPGDGHPARMGIRRGMADLRASGTSGPADRDHGGKGHAGAGLFCREEPPARISPVIAIGTAAQHEAQPAGQKGHQRPQPGRCCQGAPWSGSWHRACGLR